MKLRGQLVILAAATCLPVLIFAVFLTVSQHQNHVAIERQSLADLAHDLSSDIDDKISLAISRLEVLATSTYLDTGDLKQFYEQAARALGLNTPFEAFVLTDPSGQQVVNTRLPFGSRLPITGTPEFNAMIAKMRRPVVSNLFLGGVVKTPVIAVGVPVIRNGEVKYTLTSNAAPKFLTDLLIRQKLPSGWLATIIDRKQIIVARLANIDKFLGQPASPAFAAKSKNEPQGIFTGVNREGVAVSAAYQRSDFTGWTVGVAIPTALLEAPLWRSFRTLALGGALLLLFGFALAFYFGRRITRSIASLSERAEALGRGETPAPLSSSILEVNQVAHALQDAGAKRLRAESALRKSEASLATAQERARIGNWEIDLTAQTGWWSAEMFRLFNRDPARGVPSAAEFVDAVRADDRSAIDEARARAIRTGDECNVEFRSATGGGSERYFNAILRATQEPDGRVVQLVGTVQDITERKQIEIQTQKQNQELQLLHEIGQEISALAAPNKELKNTLEQILDKLVAVGSFDLASMSVESFFHEQEPTVVQKGYRNPARIERSARSGHRVSELPDWVRYRAVQAGHPRTVEDVQNFDGLATLKAEGVCSALLVPLHQNENIQGVLRLGNRSPRKFTAGEIRFYETIGDYLAAAVQKHRLWESLTTAKQGLEVEVAARTRELTEANTKLRALDQLKSQFIANMSHELRTPLNAIIGFSQLMHDGKAGGPASAEQKEYLGDILDSGKHLLQLINDVLDLSGVEAGRMVVLKSTFPIEEVVVEVTQSVAPIMSVKGLKLIRDVPPDLPPITSDRRKLLQILLNLASNAVKFTDHGEIGIRCETVSGSLRVSVSDTGIGIKPEDRALLFQPFSQIDGGMRKRHEGTGLGLYLSKKLAELLGGDLTVESAHDNGATFTLTIPLLG